MAVTATHLTTAASDADATSYATASITPAAGRLVLAFVSNEVAAGVPAVPTLAGNGLNYVPHATVVVGFTRLSLFRALSLGTIAGVVTIDFGAQTQIGASWSIAHYAGVNPGGTDGSAAIVQSATNSNAAATSLLVTLAAFAAAGNATVGGFRHALAENATAGTGFAILGQANGAAPARNHATEFKSTNDTTVDATWATGANNLGIAVELSAATSSPRTGLITPSEPPERMPWPTGLIPTARALGALKAHTDDRFMGGIGFSPLRCDPPQVFALCATVDLLALPNRDEARVFDPLVVVGDDICSPVAWETNNGEGRAREQLLTIGSKPIETELWTGATTGSPHLGAATTTVVVAGAQTPVVGLAALEQAIANGSAGSGAIYARPSLVEVWDAAGLLRVDADGVIRTINGTPVIAGSGFPGTGPNAEAVTTTSEWAYATDAFEVHIGPALSQTSGVVEATDYATNITAFRVEMGAITIWGGCVTVAVEVNPAVSDEGGLTNAQLRATPVPVSGTVTTTGLTDAQLRATPVPVSAAALPLPAGAATAANQPAQPTIFKTVIATAAGDTLVHDTTAGLKFRLLGYEVIVTANAAAAGGAVVEVVLRDAATAMGVGMSVFAPAVAGTVFGGGASSGWVPLGAGILSSTIANDINVNLSAALTSGEVRVVVGLREE